MTGELPDILQVDLSKVERFKKSLMGHIAKNDPDTILNAMGIDFIAHLLSHGKTKADICELLGIDRHCLGRWIKKDDDRKDIIDETAEAFADDLLDAANRVISDEKDSAMLTAKTNAMMKLADRIRPRREKKVDETPHYHFHIDAGVEFGMRPQKEISGFEIDTETQDIPAIVAKEQS